MIELDTDRVERVRSLAGEFTATSREFDLLHRVVTQSYKADFARHDVVRCIAAISFLLSGQPDNFDDLHAPADGLALAVRLFRDAEPQSPSYSLLVDHARQVLNCAPRPSESGYVDLEAHHLALLGGRALFTGILRSMMTSYRPERGARMYPEAVFSDLALWVRPEVARAAIAGRRHWHDWSRATRP